MENNDDRLGPLEDAVNGEAFEIRVFRERATTMYLQRNPHPGFTHGPNSDRASDCPRLAPRCIHGVNYGKERRLLGGRKPGCVPLRRPRVRSAIFTRFASARLVSTLKGVRKFARVCCSRDFIRARLRSSCLFVLFNRASIAGRPFGAFSSSNFRKAASM